VDIAVVAALYVQHRAGPGPPVLVWMDRNDRGRGGTGEHLPSGSSSPPGRAPLEADLLEGRRLP